MTIQLMVVVNGTFQLMVAVVNGTFQLMVAVVNGTFQLMVAAFSVGQHVHQRWSAAV